jgi:hypothetical protein
MHVLLVQWKSFKLTDVTMIVKVFMVTVIFVHISAFKLKPISEITRSVIRKYNIRCVQVLHSANPGKFHSI